MLNTILGFGGRIGRMRYLLLSLALAFAMTLLCFTLVFTMASPASLRAAAAQDALPAPIMAAGLFVVTPVFLWFTLCLQAKRLRDIGWSPLYVLSGWIAFNAADMMVAYAQPGLATASHDGTALGTIVNLAMVAVLLFWPGDGRADHWTPPTFGTSAPAPRQARRVAHPRPAAPAPAPAVGFGRRGI